MFRVRAPLTFAAAFMVVALVVAVFVGGRLVEEWRSFNGPAPAAGAQHATLAELEARPIELPRVAVTAACPAGPVDSAGNFGAGPFHGVPQGSRAGTSWGSYWTLAAKVDPGQSGLLLVRAIDIKTGQRFVFVGRYAAGAVVGSDQLSGTTVQQRAEMVLDESAGQRSWQFTVGVPAGDSGCYGWQVDGDGFTETFVFSLT